MVVKPDGSVGCDRRGARRAPFAWSAPAPCGKNSLPHPAAMAPAPEIAAARQRAAVATDAVLLSARSSRTCALCQGDEGARPGLEVGFGLGGDRALAGCAPPGGAVAVDTESNPSVLHQRRGQTNAARIGGVGGAVLHSAWVSGRPGSGGGHEPDALAGGVGHVVPNARRRAQRPRHLREPQWGAAAAELPAEASGSWPRPDPG